jgi:Low affinity iron permease
MGRHRATQNRDTLALQIKLSELILALEGARNELAAIEQQPEGALKDMAEEIQERAGRGLEISNQQMTYSGASLRRASCAHWAARKPSKATGTMRCQPSARPASMATLRSLGSIRRAATP